MVLNSLGPLSVFAAVLLDLVKLAFGTTASDDSFFSSSRLSMVVGNFSFSSFVVDKSLLVLLDGSAVVFVDGIGILSKSSLISLVTISCGFSLAFSSTSI